MRELSDTMIEETALQQYKERYHLENEFVVEPDPMWQLGFLAGYRRAEKEKQ
jgi:hypothetical protein